MRCVREMGMRVWTVHLRIYINFTLAGRPSSELHYIILFFPTTILFTYSSFHCRTLHYYYLQMNVSRSIAGVAYVFSWVLLS